MEINEELYCCPIAKFVIFCYIFTKNITKYHKFSYQIAWIFDIIYYKI